MYVSFWKDLFKETYRIRGGLHSRSFVGKIQQDDEEKKVVATFFQPEIGVAASLACGSRFCGVCPPDPYLGNEKQQVRAGRSGARAPLRQKLLNQLHRFRVAVYGVFLWLAGPRIPIWKLERSWCSRFEASRGCMAGV